MRFATVLLFAALGLAGPAAEYVNAAHPEYTLQSLDVPADLLGINDHGVIVGTYDDFTRGMVAIPSP